MGKQIGIYGSGTIGACQATLVGHQRGDKFQNILFAVDVRHGVIAHTLGKVDGVEEF